MMMCVKTASLLFFTCLSAVSFSADQRFFAAAAEESSNPRRNTAMKSILRNLPSSLNLRRSLNVFGGGAGGTVDVIGDGRLTWKEIDGTMTLAVDVVTASSEPDADTIMRSELTAAGGITLTSCVDYLCGGYMDPFALMDLEDLPSVAIIRPAYRRTAHSKSNGGRLLKPNEDCDSNVTEVVGSRTSLQIPKILEEYPELTGGNLKIGVISTSFNNLGGYKGDVKCKFLPDGVEILHDAEYDPDRPNDDEGRGMAQVIYASAKDIKIAFHDGGVTAADQAKGMKALAEAGCDVIADDLGRALEPWFQFGLLTKTANEIVEKYGVPYFIAVDNSGGGAWTGGPYKKGPCPEWVKDDKVEPKSCHVFDNGKTFQSLTTTPGKENIRPELQWDSPYKSTGPKGSDNDLNVYIAIDDELCEEEHCNGVEHNIGHDPIETFTLRVDTEKDTENIKIAIALIDGPEPSFMKWGADNHPASFYKDVDPPFNASPFVPWANTPYTCATGAASMLQTFGALVKEDDSSTGGSQPIFFDSQGNRYEKPRKFKKPNVIGPDASQTSFFGDAIIDHDTYSFMPKEGGHLFFGTSCAAPNVAALALLLRQVDYDLTPDEICDLLERTAIDMDKPGFDYNTGHGFVNGYLAVSKAVEAKKKSNTSKSTKRSKKDSKGVKSNEPDDDSDRYEYCDYTTKEESKNIESRGGLDTFDKPEYSAQMKLLQGYFGVNDGN